MRIRKAELPDLNQCLLLDHSFETQYVWQLYLSENSDGDKNITFRTVKLPRPMHVEYPRDTDTLLGDWQDEAYVLVAEEGDQVLGYLDLTVEEWNHTGWLNHLAVGRQHRRLGLGSALLRSGLDWAEDRRLRAVMGEVQTKNHPTISFLQKHGFVFCGFNDRYYTNQDIALFFSLTLR